MPGIIPQSEWGPWSRSGIEANIAKGSETDPYSGTALMNPQQQEYWRNVLNQMDAQGADYSFQTLGQEAPISNSTKTFGGQVVDFITNPGVMMALGGAYGMGAFGGAGAGAVAGGAAAGAPEVTGAAGELGAGGAVGGAAATSPSLYGS